MTAAATAIRERDAGMQCALDHAEREVVHWGDVALAFVHRYARRHAQFISEECTDAATEYGICTPSSRAWGPVFRRAHRLGIIAHVGFGISNRRHRSPTILWTSSVFKADR